MHKSKMSAGARKFTVLFNYLFPIRTLKKNELPSPDPPTGTFSTSDQQDIAQITLENGDQES